MLVSIMTVNNEIGVVQPIRKIAKICFDNNVYFHTDAAQAVAKVPIDVRKDNIDLMSLTAHKFYGPKGIGALFVSNKSQVELKPLMSGGGQERGFRSGTLAPHLVVGLGET
jgi:cysteine desulfurase